MQLEAKFTDKPTGIYFDQFILQYFPIHSPFGFFLVRQPGCAQLLIQYAGGTGLTLTQTWNTLNALDTKIEINDTIAKGLKAEILGSFAPTTQKKGAKVNLHFKQPNFHGRAFFDLLKGPTATVDAVIGQDGFLAGATAGYDVQKAAITSYSAAVGYTAPTYSAAITAADNLSVFSASYYHKVNTQVEAGAKATWDSKNTNSVGLEVASKYRLDPLSFAKVSNFCRNVTKLSLMQGNFRSRLTTVVLPPLPTTLFSDLVPPLVSVPPSIPKSSTKLPTRLAQASHSSHRSGLFEIWRLAVR